MIHTVLLHLKRDVGLAQFRKITFLNYFRLVILGNSLRVKFVTMVLKPYNITIFIFISVESRLNVHDLRTQYTIMNM